MEVASLAIKIEEILEDSDLNIAVYKYIHVNLGGKVVSQLFGIVGQPEKIVKKKMESII